MLIKYSVKPRWPDLTKECVDSLDCSDMDYTISFYSFQDECAICCCENFLSPHGQQLLDTQFK